MIEKSHTDTDAQAVGMRECLQSIADADDSEPREPDDADWRFRFLEAQRAARCALAPEPSPAATVETEDNCSCGGGDASGHDSMCPERCSAGSLSEEERHAINHARYQVEHASPEKPDCCFDFDLVTDLLRVIDRFSVSPQQLPVPWESLTAIIRPMIESVCSDGNSDAARLAKDIADRILASLSLTRPQRVSESAPGASIPAQRPGE